MRANQAIAAIALSGVFAVGAILYNQPETLPPESGLGLDETASAPATPRQIREAQIAPPEQQVQAPKAEERGPASLAPDTASADVRTLRRPLRSSIRVLETLLTRDAPGANGSHLLTQIVRTGFKYPLIRIEKQVAASGALLRSQEMVADHVLVQLQSGATRQDLEDVLARQNGFTAYVRYASRTPGIYLVAFDGIDPAAMERVMRSLSSETHVVARTEPDLIVHAL